MRLRTGIDDDTPSLDMTPMIDCVFLLLIFFLVAATIRKKHQELPIELPSSGNSIAKKAPDDTVVVSLFRERDQVVYAFSTIGEMMATTGGAREVVTWQQLVNKLRDAAVANPGRAVRIDADHSVPYGKVAQLVDHCELYRLRRIGMRMRDNTGGAK